MAWVTEYDMKWVGDNVEGTIAIQRDGGTYIGPLKLKRGTLEIRGILADWETHIVKTNCSFVISNTGTDATEWQELLPLMTISNGQYQIVVEQTGGVFDDMTLFVGNINCEAVSQNMLYFSELKITASGLINKLQYVEPTGITDPVRNDSLINIIDYCLRQTGASYNIRVGCSLQENSAGGYASTASLFSECGITTELFWEDNYKRKSALEIIEMILTSFDCYLYWYQDYWYIEYYEDLGKTTKPFVEYTAGVSYKVGGVGTAVIETPNQWDIYDTEDFYAQIAGTQILTVNPGMKEIEIDLKQQQFFNMVNGSMPYVDRGNSPEDVYYREWYADQAYTSWFAITPKPSQPNRIYTEPYLTIAHGIGRISLASVSAVNFWHGLHTRFRCSIYPDSEITLFWKAAVAVLPDPFSPTYGDPDAFYDTPASVYVRFYWTIYINDTSQYVSYDINADPQWSLSATQPANYLEVTAAAYDLERSLHETTVSIPIGDEELFPTLADFVDSIGVGLDITFIIGMTVLEAPDDPYWPAPNDTAPMLKEWIGDISVSLTGDPEVNTVKGDIVSNFLDKKTISLHLFDTENWNYRNSIMMDVDGTNYYINKTSEWISNDASSATAAAPLVDVLLASKFRLYRIARQKITMSNYLKTELFIYKYKVPFSASFRIGEIWNDAKQPTLKFVMLGDTYFPDKDIHKLILVEYDDTEDITLLG